MKKCEIAKILEDLTPEKLEEVSDLLVTALGEPVDAEPQSWIEGDRRFQCENVRAGRLCMRKEITDPAVRKKLADELAAAKVVKKPDPALDLENLLTPDALVGKPDPLEGTIESMTPDALRDIVADPAVVKKVIPAAAAKARADLEDQLTPDDLK